jgi:hypothetical protein
VDPSKLQPPTPRVGPRDERLLAFAAEHRLVLAAQVGVLLDVSAPTAAARLRALVRAGYLRRERPLAGPGCYLIERRGLAAIGSQLPRPRDLDLATYRHDVGLGWLWLAARRGAFGSVRAIVSERQMRSHDGRLRPPDPRSRDQRAPAPEDRLGVRLPGPGPRGGERRHYPDLLLDLSSGHRVAVELELTPKSPRRLREILGGYAIDSRVDAVLYLVERPSIGRAVERAAASLGTGPMVHVQTVALASPGAGRAAPGRELARPQPAVMAR